MQLVSIDNPVLTKTAHYVLEISNYAQVAQDMLNVLSKWNAVGLAAPQIGISKRFFVTKDRIHFNPSVLAHSNSYITRKEECLSLPKTRVLISRPEWIEIVSWNESGEFYTNTLCDWDARVFLHELDHLNGKLIIHYT